MTSMNTMPYTTATSSHCRGSAGTFFRMKYSIAAATKQMKKCSAAPSSTISMPPSRAALPIRQPATPFHGSIHEPPFIVRVIDANRKSASPAVKPASSTMLRAWLLVGDCALIDCLLCRGEQTSADDAARSLGLSQPKRIVPDPGLRRRQPRPQLHEVERQQHRARGHCRRRDVEPGIVVIRVEDPPA